MNKYKVLSAITVGGVEHAVDEVVELSEEAATEFVSAGTVELVPADAGADEGAAAAGEGEGSAAAGEGASE